MTSQSSFLSTDSEKCFDLLNYFSFSKKINIVFTQSNNNLNVIKIPLSGNSLLKILTLSKLSSKKQVLSHVNLDLSTERSDYSRNDSIINGASKFNVFFMWNSIPISKKTIKKLSALMFNNNLKYLSPYLKVSITESNDSFNSFHSIFKMSSFNEKSELSYKTSNANSRKTKSISNLEENIIKFIRNKYSNGGEDTFIKAQLYEWKYFNYKNNKIERLDVNMLLNYTETEKEENSDIFYIDDKEENQKEVLKKEEENQKKKYYVVTVAKIKECPI